MSTVRLTRRGRLLVRTLPLFLVTATAVQISMHRSSAAPHPRASAPPPASSAATPTATPTVSAAPLPTHHPTPSATPTPSPVRTAAFDVAPGASKVHGTGPLRRFTVEVERGQPDSPAAFAAAVERVLFDARGWAGSVSLQRVDSGPVAFRVVLASARTTDRLCRPLETGGIFSCFQHGRAVLNARRWYGGADAYRGDLAAYRIYMVNHEVGHALGHGHRYECGPGGLAYVMIQQTKGLLGCRRNVWPLPGER